MRTSLPNQPDLGADACAQFDHCAIAIRTRQFADIFHEVRTPLGAVLGLSRLALNQCESPAIRGYLENIHHATTDLLQLLNDALESAPLGVGGMQLN